MQWFYKWLGNKIRQAREDNEPTIGLARPPRKLVAARDNDDLSTEPITFKMFKASGGWAIEFRQYDSRNDRFDAHLYVVNDEEELGKHISQIITMEALKR